jgi:hypothetical protein
MWGTSTVGFAPRKQDLTLYVGRGVDDTLLSALGEHKMAGGACTSNA